AQIRMPLKDRTIYRAETASRVWWSQDGPVVVQALAAREETPVGVSPPEEVTGLIDNVFDPAGDRIYFGFGDDGDDENDDPDEFWVEHPFAPGSEEFYEFSSGDTLNLSFPDLRRLQVVELRVIPREASIHLLTGSFWIEPESGALVRGVYRLAKDIDVELDLMVGEDEKDLPIPGIFKPMTFTISLITVEYALWDFKYWLPRSMRFEGMARAGIIKAPGALDVSYRIEEVVGVDDAEDDSARFDAFARADSILETWQAESGYLLEEEWREWIEDPDLARRIRAETQRGVRGVNNGKETYLLLPPDPESLHTNELLPPPIWEEAPGFTSEAELRDFAERLADIPTPAAAAPRLRLDWGFAREDLVRFNRVEGLSLGAQGVRPLDTPFGPADGRLVGRFGTADVEPSLELDLRWDGVRREFRFEAYHKLAAVDPGGRHLGFGNSLIALLFGRDDGEYYRASGARITLEPASDQRRSWTWTLYGEHQEGVERNTNVSLPWLFNSGYAFRETIEGAQADQFGTRLTLRPYWGSERTGFQIGTEFSLQSEVGDYRFARADATLRTAFSITPKIRSALELAGGTSWGDVPAQRLWYLGGSSSLRGYNGSTVMGTSFLRARAELARVYPLVSVSVFGDAGWAGDRGDIAVRDARFSIGVGGSVLDGLMRVDIARALRDPTGWRLELYLDGIL
ncbi:MAG: hypothetical protein ACC667_02070, partial [Longimicrobiales bacterium]